MDSARERYRGQDPGRPPRDYDVAAQARQSMPNVQQIPPSAGPSLHRAVDVSVFLIELVRDSAAFNAVYAEPFASVKTTPTTVEVRALPRPIAAELKVIARPGDVP